MSALNPPKQISRRQELRQDQVITAYARSYGFFEEHRPLVYGILAAVVIAAFGIVGYVLYQQSQNEEAVVVLANAVRYYEEGQFREALDGAGGAPGLLAIIDEYGGTAAANLAHYYAADAYFRLGEYETALEHFEAFDAEANLLGAGALAGEAATQESLGAFEEAGDLYLEAAALFPADLRAPQYRLSAGRAYEAAGDYDAALSVYESIREDYPDSPVAANLELVLARVRARLATG